MGGTRDMHRVDPEVKGHATYFRTCRANKYREMFVTSQLFEFWNLSIEIESNDYLVSNKSDI